MSYIPCWEGEEHRLGDLVNLFSVELCHSFKVIVLSQFSSIHSACHFGIL